MSFILPYFLSLRITYIIYKLYYFKTIHNLALFFFGFCQLHAYYFQPNIDDARSVSFSPTEAVTYWLLYAFLEVVAVPSQRVLQDEKYHRDSSSSGSQSYGCGECNGWKPPIVRRQCYLPLDIGNTLWHREYSRINSLLYGRATAVGQHRRRSHRHEQKLRPTTKDGCVDHSSSKTVPPVTTTTTSMQTMLAPASGQPSSWRSCFIRDVLSCHKSGSKCHLLGEGGNGRLRGYSMSL